MGGDQVSGGVSFPCQHATPVANKKKILKKVKLSYDWLNILRLDEDDVWLVQYNYNQWFIKRLSIWFHDC